MRTLAFFWPQIPLPCFSHADFWLLASFCGEPRGKSPGFFFYALSSRTQINVFGRSFGLGGERAIHGRPCPSPSFFFYLLE